MRLLNTILLCALVVGQGKLWFGDGGIRELKAIEQRVSIQQAENEHLLKRNKALAREVRDLKNGLDAIEEHARNELGLVGKDEEFFQIVDASAALKTR